MAEYRIETGCVYKQFIISHIDISYDDYHRGNPYNTTFNVEVISGNFTGLSEFEYDFKELIRFITELKELYDFKLKTVELSDICYGSKIQFDMDNVGHVNISGNIYGEAMENSMSFSFQTDQTAILSFYNALHKDFIADKDAL